MRTVDFTPLYRSIVGFDRLADMMDSATKIESGFGEADLTVEVQENILTIAGKIVEKDDTESRRFLHRGIAERAFERRFHLADHVEVADAELLNGLLTVRLVREIPEAAKPRKIAISDVSGKSNARLIETRKTKAA